MRPPGCPPSPCLWPALSLGGGCFSGQEGVVPQVGTASEWTPGSRGQQGHGHGHDSTGPRGQPCAWRDPVGTACLWEATASSGQRWELRAAHRVSAVTSRGLEGWAWLPGPDCRLRACVHACSCVHVCVHARVHACMCVVGSASLLPAPCTDLPFVIARSLALGWDSSHSICVAGWLTAPAVAQPLSQGTKGVFVGGGFVEESRSGPKTSFQQRSF